MDLLKDIKEGKADWENEDDKEDKRKEAIEFARKHKGLFKSFDNDLERNIRFLIALLVLVFLAVCCLGGVGVWKLWKSKISGEEQIKQAELQAIQRVQAVAN